MIGIVPKLQSFVVNSYNWSDKSKAFLMLNNGPFTGNIILIAKFIFGVHLLNGLFLLPT